MSDNTDTTMGNKDAHLVRKIVFIVIISLIILSIIGVLSVYIFFKSALSPVDAKNKEEIEVTIPLGSTPSEIGAILEENGVIKNASIFKLYIKIKNEADFQAGNYTFSPSQDVDEIITVLKDGKLMEEPLYTVTIPEGKTIDQIAEIYSHVLPITKKELLEKVNDQKYIKELIDKYPSILTDVILNKDIRTPLEGYLFAATYEFYEEPTPEFIIETMLDKTNEVVGGYEQLMAEKDLTIHEAITFASLVENEAKTSEQRELIAGVFYNRLEEGIPLQTDPTVLYALGEHKDKVLYKDLEIDSPYNTYKITELPIGPISNFGENALEATLEPKENDYIYFLHDEKGKIHYSKTHEEHLKLKEKYIQ